MSAKKHPNKTTSYEELQGIISRFVEGTSDVFAQEAVNLLKENGIKLREDDGSVVEVTISFPSTVKHSIALGIRYRKRNGSYAEDIFLFQKGLKISKLYKGAAEKLMPEYKGTHHRSYLNS